MTEKDLLNVRDVSRLSRLVFGVLFIGVFSGCVSIRENRREMRESYIQGLEKARHLAYYAKCEDAVDLISGRINVEEMK